jgi:hypothetical protein
VSSTLCAARPQDRKTAIPQDRKTARPRCFIRFRCLRLVDRHLDTFLFSAKSKSVLYAVCRKTARPQDRKTALLYSISMSPAGGQTPGHFFIFGQIQKCPPGCVSQQRTTARPHCFTRHVEGKRSTSCCSSWTDG